MNLQGLQAGQPALCGHLGVDRDMARRPKLVSELDQLKDAVVAGEGATHDAAQHGYHQGGVALLL